MLNPKLYDPDVEKKSMRDGFGDGLAEAGEENKDLYVLSADLKDSTKVTKFAQKFPSRFIEVGVAEQNLVTIASGMASLGKTVVATSYAVFSPGRNWEQIRTTICYNNQPVKIVGSHAGLTVGADGATHQALEDMALMRVLPNMVVISPCDYLEAKKATLEMMKINKPVYLRLTRNDVPLVTTPETPFKIGKAEVFLEGKDISIIATGQMVYFALLAAEQLKEHRILAQVINCSTIKPLDKKGILKAVDRTRAVVTVEEHQVQGGLGGAVAELLSQNDPMPIQIIGVEDQFGQSGEAGELLNRYGLNVDNIIKATIKALRMKG